MNKLIFFEKNENSPYFLNRPRIINHEYEFKDLLLKKKNMNRCFQN